MSVGADLAAAVAHHQAGRLGEARRLYQSILAAAPNHPDALHLLGLIHHQQGDNPTARDLIERAIGVKGGTAAYHNNLGSVLLALDDAAAAAIALRRALVINPDYVEAHNNLGNALQQQGDASAAEDCYRRALALRPDYAEAHCNLGSAQEAQGNLAAAATSHRAAIHARPDFARAHAELANILQEEGDTAGAEDAYRRALDLDPNHAAAHAGLAALCERASRLEDASASASAALAIDADNILAHLVMAKCARRTGHPEDGLRRLRALDPARLDAASRAAIAFEQGSLCDRMGEYREAYDHYVAGNRHNADHWRTRQADPAAYPGRIARLDAAFDADWVASWTPPVPEERPPPIFLVGFPRSGTTLLDQILDAHPALATLEERPAIDVVGAAVAALPDGYPAALAGMDAATIATLRQVYYDEVARHLDDLGPGVTLVDKMPLNTTDIGLIHRLFPNARILLSLRHPCDVVLSGFMQAFSPNQAMVHFTTLADTARLYAAVMGLWHRYVEVLPLHVHQVRYEDLVADFAEATRGILDFLGLPWDDAVLGYQERAQTRMITTPSYHQVVQPIYGRSIGRWRHYQDEIAPVVDTLRPFIKAFGYELP